MKIDINKNCTDFNSYRAARVKSLFNAESGANFSLHVDIPIDDKGWSLGLIVGPSGSGKTSIGKELWGGGAFYDGGDWPHDKPIVDAIAPDGDFNDVTAALGSVGLGTVPTWLRPYHVLSMGEQFRANLARIINEAPKQVVIDEFTSVVDRQIAKFGALAFAKSWNRLAKEGGNQCVLLSCHYDIIDWVEPDWVFDTQTGKYSGRSLWRRPKFDLEIWQTNSSYWKLFEPHHYLKLPPMFAATYYVGTVDGEPVTHLGVSTRPGMKEGRACRLVVMPEWQGAGVGLRFLNAICEMWLKGENRHNIKMPMLFHTSHPQLCQALRRMPEWVQVSAILHGSSIKKAIDRAGKTKRYDKSGVITGSVGGGHFRAVQGFRYLGEYSPNVKKMAKAG